MKVCYSSNRKPIHTPQPKVESRGAEVQREPSVLAGGVGGRSWPSMTDIAGQGRRSQGINALTSCSSLLGFPCQPHHWPSPPGEQGRMGTGGKSGRNRADSQPGQRWARPFTCGSENNPLPKTTQSMSDSEMMTLPPISKFRLC